MRLILIRISAVLIALFIIMPIAVNAQIQNISSTDLIDNASEFDGKAVSYCGEIIGDILYRGDYAFINVSDGANAIGIYIPSSEAKKIEYTGKYRVTGDTVALTGTFHRACTEHGGDMDIHADIIDITAKGHTGSDNSSKALPIAAGVLPLCAVAATIIMLRKRNI